LPTGNGDFLPRKNFPSTAIV